MDDIKQSNLLDNFTKYILVKLVSKDKTIMDNWFLEDGIILGRVGISPNLRKTIMKLNYNNEIAGYLGIKRTYKYPNNISYLKKDVVDYI